MRRKFDLETTPLEIMEGSEGGSGEEVVLVMFFFDSQGDDAGGIYLHPATFPPQYRIYHCRKNYTNFQTDPPISKDRIWRITKLRTSEGTRLHIHCNDVEVLDLLLSDRNCETNKNWNEIWSREVKMIDFNSQDTASHYFRPYAAAG